MKKIFSAIFAGVLAMSTLFGCDMGGGGNGDKPETPDKPGTITRVDDNRNLTVEEYTAYNTVGTDALGRVISEVDGKRDGARYVGIWYSLWHGQHNDQQKNVYDNQKIIDEQGEQYLLSIGDSEYSKVGEFHYCSEPLYGYYNMMDPWVVTRHVEMLTNAGIDYLCFDTTNSIVYPDVVKLVLKTLMDFQKKGYNVPKVMFYTNSYSGTTASKIYNEFYKTDMYDSIWFAPNGKPLLAGITETNGGSSDQQMWNPTYNDCIPQELYDRLEIVESQWPQGIWENPNAIPWMSWKYPQSIHDKYKAISVSVAQHNTSTVQFSDKYPVSSRGYDYKTGTVEKNYQAGKNFRNEWQSVFDYEAEGKEVRNVMITSWNEWMAIKYRQADDRYTFCDVYNEEYSRDIEPMKGSCKDNFYMQLTENIRKYKYTEAKHYKYQKLTMDISDSDLSMWDVVNAHYRDFEGDAIARSYKSSTANSVLYKDNSNRNDITDIKVTHNSKNLFIYVKTKDDVTAHTANDKGWMNVLINTGSSDKNFEGYNFVINRNPTSDGITSIEKSTGGYNWTETASAEYAVYGNVILYSIPLSSLGLTADNCYIKFKVTDNITKPDDIMDYYVSGDSAPIGRLSYSYGY